MEMIGAYEAKTHLPQLLDRVARGERLTITRHGKPVAQLIPVATDRQRAQQAAARIIERAAAPQESIAGGSDGHDPRAAPLLTSIVIDNSVFLARCMGDEEEPAATSAMRTVALSA